MHVAAPAAVSQPVAIEMDVPVPPSFLQHLQNINSMEGSRVSFEGGVDGKPQPSIKWYVSLLSTRVSLSLWFSLVD